MEAKEHLNLWKKYFMRELPIGWKLPTYPDGSPGDEEYVFQLIERPAMAYEKISGKKGITPPVSSLKLCFYFDGDQALMPLNFRLGI